MIRWEKYRWMLLLVAAWSSPGLARKPVELMPREDLAVEADRAPTESYSYSQARESYHHRRNRSARLLVGGGITTIAERNASALERRNHTVYLAAGGESHQGYLGGDLDLYFGTASVNRGTTSGALINQQSGSLQQFGGMFDMTAELPLDIAGILIVPRAGMGYGIQHLSLSRDIGLNNTPTVNLGTKQTVHGAFGMGGILLSPVSWLGLSADYSISFFSTGSVSGAVSTADISLGNGGSSFDRIRASAMVRVARGFSIGAQFVQRRLYINVPVINDPGGVLAPKQMHFLGVLGLEL